MLSINQIPKTDLPQNRNEAEIALVQLEQIRVKKIVQNQNCCYEHLRPAADLRFF